MLLSATHVAVLYGKAVGIQDVSVEVAEGSVVCLVGANGAGKSTLMRVLSGLVPLAEGEIRFVGRDLAGVPAPERVRRGLVQVPEGRHLFPYLSVMSNLKLGASIRKDRAVRRDLEEVLGYFPVLKERRNQAAGTMSGGEQQMLAIGRALMARPRLLLMDEPSLGLAPAVLSNQVVPVIRRIKAGGVGVLLAEQNVLVAFEVADFVIVLQTGRVVFSGTITEARSSKSIREAFLGG